MSDKDTRRDFGTVYRRKGSRHWWIRYSVDGKRHYESSSSTKKRDAEKLLAKREAELGLGRLPQPDVKRTSFEDLAKIIEDEYTMNGRKSLPRLKTSLRHLRAFFGGMRARSITSDRLNAYVVHRQAEGAAPSSIQKELAAIRRAFRLARRAKKVAEIPEIPTLEIDNTRTGFFEEGDLQAVLKELSHDIAPIIEFAYLTGWRIRSEVLPLTWRQVDFDAGVVRLEPGTTKNKDGRTFPFSALPRLEELLREQRERTSAVEKMTGRIISHVFHRDGKPMADFRGAWWSACVRAGLGHWKDPENRKGYVGPVPHDLRRSAVRNLERAGVPRAVAMKLVGHKTESIYRRYAIVAESDLREGVEKLARLRESSASNTRTVALKQKRG